MTNMPPSPASVEVVIGRSLAICAHPIVAWRLRSLYVRAQMIAGYLVASYIFCLTMLLVF
jgi:hypothetical protein